VVDDGQYTIISSTLREAGDKIHGDLSERQGISRDSYLIERRMHPVGEIFVLLANGTSFHVLFDPILYAWPPVPV